MSSLRAIVGGEVPDGARIMLDVKGDELAAEVKEAEKIEAKEEEAEVQARARLVKTEPENGYWKLALG